MFKRLLIAVLVFCTTTAHAQFTPGQVLTATQLNNALAVKADVAALSGSAGSANVGFIQSGTGATSTTVQDKLRDFVRVKDFGGAENGTTNDAPALTAALNAACPGKGVTFKNKLYLATSVTIPANCELRGPLDNVGEQASGNYNTVGVILLPSSATINVGQGSSIVGAYILNNALANSLPFADATSAQNAVNAFSGTAITAAGSDVQVRDVWIGGFAQAFYSTGRERTKLQRVQIDSTNGVWVNDSTDIARISDVHAWPFLTTHRSWTNGTVLRRQGSAFKMTGRFDTGFLDNCFDYGWDIGFDIQALNEIDIINSFSDGGSLGVGQIGFKLSGSAELVNIIGGGSSGKSQGLYSNVTPTSLSGAITVNGAHFWGNYAHIVSDNHRVLNINGAYFRDTNGGSRTGVTLNSGVAGKTSVTNSVFDALTTPYSIASGAPARNLSVFGNTYNGVVSSYFENTVSDNSDGSINKYKYSASGASPALKFYQAAGTATAPTASPNGAQVAITQALVYDGSAFSPIAQIRADAAASPTSGNTPGKWVISTTPAGTASPVDVTAIDSAGNVYPVTDNVASSGKSGNRWNNLHAVLGTFSGQITSTVSTGTAPFTVASTTNVANLNASSLNGATFAAPGAIGGTTPGTGAFTSVTTSGSVTVGSTSSFSPVAGTALQQLGTAGGSAVFNQSRATNDAFGPVISQSKTRSATIGTHTIVTSGDNLGRIWAYGSDGANFIQATAIESYSDGAPATNGMPGRIIFSTSASGSGTPTERLRIDSTGNVLLRSTGGLGYGAGAGGVVTQLTSKATGVTLNTPTGQITMNNAALAAAATACFTLTNSVIAATDVVNASIASGATAGAYTLQVDAVAAGSSRMCVNNRSAGSLSEAIVINYAVIKGSAN